MKIDVVIFWDVMLCLHCGRVSVFLTTMESLSSGWRWR